MDVAMDESFICFTFIYLFFFCSILSMVFKGVFKLFGDCEGVQEYIKEKLYK